MLLAPVDGGAGTLGTDLTIDGVIGLADTDAGPATIGPLDIGAVNGDPTESEC